MKKGSTKKKLDPQRISIIVMYVLVVIPVIVSAIQVFKANNPKQNIKKNYSDLIDENEIADLSVCEFTYNGIAHSDEKKSNGDPKFSVRYDSTVKVSVDADAIDKKIDEDKKIVTFRFPEFTIGNPIINIATLDYMPSDRDEPIETYIALCRRDALAEANKSDKLISSARENLQSIIEAFYEPVLPGYSFECYFDDGEGGDGK